MTQQSGTCLPVATWFLFSDQGEPLGQIYRGEKEAVPTVGEGVSDRDGRTVGEVMEFAELTATCAMRRFRVVVRVAV